jgi:hypothetical protein
MRFYFQLPTTDKVPLIKTGIFLTAEMLKEKEFHCDIVQKMEEKWPDGADYQEVLHWLAEEDDTTSAFWCIARFGKADTMTEIPANFNGNNILVAGDLKIEGRVSCCALGAGGNMDLGWSVDARRDIQAGGGIKAKWSIETKGMIRADEGLEAMGINSYGSIRAKWIDCQTRIFAGLVPYRMASEDESKIFGKLKRGKICSGVHVDV